MGNLYPAAISCEVGDSLLQMEIAFRGATAHLEVAGDRRQRLTHQVWRDLDNLAVVIYLGAVICKDRQRLLRWELDAYLFQDGMGRGL